MLDIQRWTLKNVRGRAFSLSSRNFFAYDFLPRASLQIFKFHLFVVCSSSFLSLALFTCSMFPFFVRPFSKIPSHWSPMCSKLMWFPLPSPPPPTRLVFYSSISRRSLLFCFQGFWLQLSHYGSQATEISLKPVTDLKTKTRPRVARQLLVRRHLRRFPSLFKVCNRQFLLAQKFCVEIVEVIQLHTGWQMVLVTKCYRVRE